MSDKTFKVAGWSNLKGETKVRVANDLASRVKTLNKNGHTDVVLFQLPDGMELTKNGVCNFLLNDARAPAMTAEQRAATEAEYARLNKPAKGETPATEGAATDETAAAVEEGLDGEDDGDDYDAVAEEEQDEVYED